ncbi:hypothetical protein D9M72_406590 [compost metagenome]
MRHVPHRHGHAKAGGYIQQTARYLALELRAVLPEPVRFEGRTEAGLRTARTKGLEEPLEAQTVALGKNNPMIMANEFLPGVTEHPLSGRIHEHHGAVLGQHQQGVGQRINDGLVIPARNGPRFLASLRRHQSALNTK